MKNTLFFSQLDVHKFFMYSNILCNYIYIHWYITFQLECRGEQGVSFKLGKEIEKDVFHLVTSTGQRKKL